MGRRAEDPLLQGAHEEPAQGVVPPGPLPEPDEKEGARASDRSYAHASWQLVQK